MVQRRHEGSFPSAFGPTAGSFFGIDRPRRDASHIWAGFCADPSVSAAAGKTPPLDKCINRESHSSLEFPQMPWSFSHARTAADGKYSARGGPGLDLAPGGQH